jgi:hypothetical protein
MAGFENYAQDTHDIELEIERKGVALASTGPTKTPCAPSPGRRWILPAPPRRTRSSTPTTSTARLAKLELFGLAGLMLRTMQESASAAGFESHGGDAWKAFARALWAEKNLRRPD